MDEDKIIIEVEVDSNNQANSKIDSLIASTIQYTEANKKLADELKKVDLTTKEGVDQAVKINKQMQDNTATIKTNQSAVDQLKKSNQGFAENLKNVAPGLSNSIQGIQGMTKASLQFIATPIGAIIAALVGVFLLLKSALGASEESMDKFEDITAAVGAVIEVLQRRLGLLLESLIAFATGKWSEAADKATQAFSGMAEEIQNNVEAAVDLNAAMRDLEDATNDYTIASGKARVEIAKLLLMSKNRTTDEAERIKLAEKAMEIQGDLLRTEIRNADENLRIVAERLGKEKGMYRELGEDAEDYAQRVIESRKLGQEQNEEILAAFNELMSVKEKGVAFEEKVQNQIDKLQESRMEKLRKDAEEVAELAEKESDARIAAYKRQLDEKKAMDEEERKALEELAELDGEIAEDNHDAYFEKLNEDAINEFMISKQLSDDKIDLALQQDKSLEDITNRRLAREAKAAEQEKKIEQLKTDAIDYMGKKLFENKKGLQVLYNSIFKQNAIQETISNTYAAAVAVYKSAANIPYIGWILAPIAAAAVAGYGALQVANIMGLEFNFAKGGRVPRKSGTTGGRYHSEGGTKYYGEDGQVVELEKDENWYVLNRAASREINSLSAANVKHGGQSFAVKTGYAALGGQIQSSTFQNNLTASDVQRSVVEGMQGVTIVTLVEDVASGLDKKVSIEETARVL
jgi:hypothetical protein